MRPKVKICGVTRAEDARLAVELGAEYVGLNFYPPSPRFLELEPAREIAQEVAGRAIVVGVFVNAEAAAIERAIRTVELDLVQFHGDETPQDILPFAERALKVVRVEDRIDPAAVSGWQGVWGLLIDRKHPRLYGGSGESWDFTSLETTVHPRTFIAGGLGPGTVQTALEMRPYGLDLCSGVEARPGHKDHDLIRRFFEEIEDGESPPTA